MKVSASVDEISKEPKDSVLGPLLFLIVHLRALPALLGIIL